MYRIVIAVIFIFNCTFAKGNTFDFSFNNDAGALKFSVPTQGNADLDGGALVNKSNNLLVEAGLIMKGNQGDDAGGWLALGGKAIYGVIQDYLPGKSQNIESLVLGGELGYIFPAAPRFSVAFYDFFGPGATTFGDADRAYQWGAHLDYDLNSGAKIYCEYREADFRITSTGHSATLDSGIYVGIRLGLN